jgi:hypothetical protein
MRIANLQSMLLPAVLLLAVGQSGAQCSNQTLHGRYEFTITGQILTPPPAAGSVSGVAITKFDGAGSLTQVDHVVHNGTLPVEDWRPGTGSYSINSDCTGWMTIESQPTDPADTSPELKLYIVVTKDGREIRTVVSGSPTAPPFSANITSTGVRSGSTEW